MKICKKDFVFVLMCLFFVGIVYAIPLIDFIDPTPVDALKTLSRSIEINVSITEVNLDELKYNWNGINFTYYNDSLVLMYNFDNVPSLGENDTHVFDISNYSNNGTVNGSTWSSSGKYGGAFEFDGIDDYIDVGSGGSLGITDELTVAAWVKFNNVADGTRVGNIIGRYNYNPHFNFEGYTTGRLRFFWNNGEIDLYSTKDLRGEWHYVVAVRDNTLNNITLYIDGAFEAQESAGTNIDIQWPLRIGGDFRATPGIPYNGTIDEVRIWNRSLSSDEVYQQYVSNLKKRDSDSWELYVNQSKNSTSGLDDGDYTYFVSSKDDSGNENLTATRTLVIDTIAPTIILISPINNSGQPQNITFNYNVTEANNVTSCSLILNSATNQTNTSIKKSITQNFTLDNLAIGSYNWSVNCTDDSNNVGESESRIFSIVKKNDFIGNTTDLTEVDISNITNFIVDKPSFGKINFTESVDLSSGGNLNTYVNISFNRIEVNSTGLSALNKTARLRLYNLTFTDPQALKDGVVCSDCTEVSYTGNTFVFDVTGFSVYTSRETPVASPISPGGGGSSGGGTTYECTKNSNCNDGYSCYNHKCVKLFDVEILKVEPSIETLDFKLDYLIKGMAEINSDVIIKFWLEKDGEKIELGQDTIYLASFETKTKSTSLNLPYSILNGDYDLYVESGYETYKAQSFRKININIPEEVKIEAELAVSSPSFWLYLVIAGLILFIAGLFIANYINKHKEFYHIYIHHKVIPRIILIKKTKWINGNVCIKSLAGKRIYTAHGYYIGRLDKAEIINNRVHSWIILPDRKFGFKRQIKMSHTYIRRISEVILVDERITGFLEMVERE